MIVCLILITNQFPLCKKENYYQFNNKCILRFNEFIKRIEKSRNELKELISNFVSWTVETQSLIKNKKSVVLNKSNTVSKKKKTVKVESMDRVIEFLKITEDNLERVVDSIKASIYLFKASVKLKEIEFN